MPKQIFKSKQLNKKTTVTIRAGWIDDSFEHAFGTKHQGFFEVTNVYLNGFEIPLDILDKKFLEEMDEYANK